MNERPQSTSTHKLHRALLIYRTTTKVKTGLHKRPHGNYIHKGSTRRHPPKT